MKSLISWLEQARMEILSSWQESDQQAEALFYGHLREHNPDWLDDIHSRQMVGVVCEIIAAVIWLAVIGGLVAFRAVV